MATDSATPHVTTELTLIRLWESQQIEEERWTEWEPRTREEAKQRWKELQDSHDHHTLLHMYKRKGVEPLKVAKYVSIFLSNTNFNAATDEMQTTWYNPPYR